jgi:hypothetical protein
MIQNDQEGNLFQILFINPFHPDKPMKKSYLEHGEQWIPGKTLKNVF